MEEIRRFERMLIAEGALILKFWFHLSKERQKKRLKKLEKRPPDPLAGDRDRLEALRALRPLPQDLRARAARDEHRRGALDRGRGHGRALPQPDRRQGHPRARCGAAPRRTRPPAPESHTGRPHAPGLDELEHPQAPRPDARSWTSTSYERELRELPGQAHPAHPAQGASGSTTSVHGLRGRRRRRQGRRHPPRHPGARRPRTTTSSRSPRPPRRSAPSPTSGASGATCRAGARLTIFDRSWYGRVLVERVEGFCSEADWMRAYSEINDFEEQLVRQRRHRPGQVLAPDQPGGAAPALRGARGDRLQALQDHRRGLAQPREVGRLRDAPSATWSTAPAPRSPPGPWSRPRTSTTPGSRSCGPSASGSRKAFKKIHSEREPEPQPPPGSGGSYPVSMEPAHPPRNRP